MCLKKIISIKNYIKNGNFLKGKYDSIIHQNAPFKIFLSNPPLQISKSKKKILAHPPPPPNPGYTPDYIETDQLKQNMCAVLLTVNPEQAI